MICRCGCGETVAPGRFKWSDRKTFINEKHKQRYFNRLHAQEKRPSRIRQKRNWFKNAVAKNKIMVREAKNRPCHDCGQVFPYYVMDLDHVRGEKKFGLGVTKASRVAVLAEIEKCEAVCANCHRVRTHQRRQFSTTP